MEQPPINHHLSKEQVSDRFAGNHSTCVCVRACVPVCALFDFQGRISSFGPIWRAEYMDFLHLEAVSNVTSPWRDALNPEGYWNSPWVPKLSRGPRLGQKLSRWTARDSRALESVVLSSKKAVRTHSWVLEVSADSLAIAALSHLPDPIPTPFLLHAAPRATFSPLSGI